MTFLVEQGGLRELQGFGILPLSTAACWGLQGLRLSLPGPWLHREGSRNGEELLDFQHQGNLDCLSSSNFSDTICSFMSFISAFRPFFIDIFQTSAMGLFAELLPSLDVS